MSADASTDVSEQLKPHKDRMIKHMNEDHADSVLVYAKHYASHITATKALITDMSGDGLTIDVSFPDGEIKNDVFVAYSRPLAAVKDVRPIVVEMHHECYNALGPAYKLQSGYYKKQLQTHLKTFTKTPVGKFSLGAAAVGLAGLCIFAYRKKQNRLQ